MVAPDCKFRNVVDEKVVKGWHRRVGSMLGGRILT
jgi:hypothetical protein